MCSVNEVCSVNRLEFFKLQSQLLIAVIVATEGIMVVDIAVASAAAIVVANEYIIFIAVVVVIAVITSTR